MVHLKQKALTWSQSKLMINRNLYKQTFWCHNHKSQLSYIVMNLLAVCASTYTLACLLKICWGRQLSGAIHKSLSRCDL